MQLRASYFKSLLLSTVYGPQNRVREKEGNGVPLRWGLPGCSSEGHQSKVLITRPLCFGALEEAEPDASSNVRFFLSDFVSQAKYPKMSSFMREGKIQEASSALGSIRPTLMQVSKPNTSSDPGFCLLHGKQASTRTLCKSFPFPILLFPPANLSAQPASTRQRHECRKVANRK